MSMLGLRKAGRPDLQRLGEGPRSHAQHMSAECKLASLGTLQACKHGAGPPHMLALHHAHALCGWQMGDNSPASSVVRIEVATMMGVQLGSSFISGTSS